MDDWKGYRTDKEKFCGSVSGSESQAAGIVAYKKLADESLQEIRTRVILVRQTCYVHPFATSRRCPMVVNPGETIDRDKKKGFIIRPVVATIGPNHNRNKTTEARTRQGSCCQREDHDGQRRVGRLDLTNTGQNISSVFVRRQGGEQSTASDFLSNHHHTQPSPPLL